MDSTHFGSLNDLSDVPIYFLAEPKTNSSPPSKRKKKPHNLPLKKFGLLSHSPSKVLLLGSPAFTNKHKNLFSGSYAFPGKQRRRENGTTKDGKLCIENIEKESDALDALPCLVGNGAFTKEISVLPVEQEHRTP